jgi:glycosyltransferase involved in cell wall biosynthesis
VKHLLCIFPWLTIGGADKFNLDMLGQLRARGWQATVVTTLAHAHPWRAEFERQGARVLDVGAAPASEQPARLMQIVADLQPGWVLVSHSALAYAALPYLRAHAPDATFVDYNHLVDPADPRGGYPAESLAAADALDLQITSSEQLRSWMIARGGDPGRIAVCTTNIDAGLWDPAAYDRPRLRANFGLPERAFVGLVAARLERVKRPVLAAAIMRDVLRAVPDAYFLVAGTGPYAGFLQSFVARHGLEGRLRLLGALDNRRIRELLALSDVLLLPSQAEGLSLAVYEAMAMGVVPVSVAVGGQAELVTPECGVLLPHGRHERQAYAAALETLARDRARLRAMGASARQRVELHFRLSQMGDRMQALLLEAARQRQLHPRPAGAATALEAARRARAVAKRDARWVAASAGPARTPRQQARALYARLVDTGAWWLVPVAERLYDARTTLRRLLYERGQQQ